jgi:Xaa-Pro aminopeptidase
MGADDISFPVIVASGANAAVPHHVPTNKTIKIGESVVLDFGFKIKGYCSDFTRTIFLKKISPEMAQIYLAAEEAYREGFKTARHNVVAKTADLAARNTLAQYNLDKYFIHSLGHGTGIDVHEAPHIHANSEEVLSNGMVFSIEPGVYVPRFGGVRIEDLVYLKNGKANYFAKASTKLKDMII